MSKQKADTEVLEVDEKETIEENNSDRPFTIPVPEGMHSPERDKNEDEDDSESTQASSEDGSDDAEEAGDDSKSWEVSSQMREAGVKLGVTATQLSDFSTEKDALKALVALNTQRMSELEDSGTKAGKEEEEEEAIELPDFEFDEDADPSLVKGVNALREATTKQLKAIEQRHKRQIEAMQSQIQEAQHSSNKSSNEAFAQRYDRWSQGQEDFQEEFGEKSVFDLPQNSPELRNHMKVVRKFEVLRAGYDALGGEVPDESKILSEAARAVFGGKSRSRSSETGSRRGVGRPSKAGKGKEKSGDEKALDAIDRFLKSKLTSDEMAEY